MPGIVGLVTEMPRARAQDELQRMLDPLRHEAFYRTGTWADPGLGVYVGWCTRTRSSSDRTPLPNQRGDVVVVFSGETFGAARNPPRMTSRADALDVEGSNDIVDEYDADEDFPAGLNGTFHGVVVDRRRGTATLFNDRYGMHSLYYRESRDGVYFAAEAKAILAVCPPLRSIDPRSLGELVSCGGVLENRTLFDGLGVLPTAARWVMRAGSPTRKESYFCRQEWEDQEPLDSKRYVDALHGALTTAVARRFAGREPIGMSLTGGLDTRMIMAVRRPRPHSLPCYTFTGIHRDSRDVVVARRVAALCGQPHHVIRVGDEFLARFPAYAERAVYLTDGRVGVGRAADLYVNELAGRIAPVRMTGNYGGELLRRVRLFNPSTTRPGPFSAEFLSSVRRAAETYRGVAHPHPLSFAMFQQAPWYQSGLRALEETQLALRSPYLDNDLVRTVFRAPPSAFRSDDLCRRLIAEADPRLARLPTDRGRGGHGILAMAEHALRELQFKAEYAYDRGLPRWAAPIDRLLAALRLERHLLGRHLFVHFRSWYREQLAGYVREVLLDPSTLSLPYFDAKSVEATVDEHVRGARHHTAAIHTALTVTLVHRLFVKPSA